MQLLASSWWSLRLAANRKSAHARLPASEAAVVAAAVAVAADTEVAVVEPADRPGRLVDTTMAALQHHQYCWLAMAWTHCRELAVVSAVLLLVLLLMAICAALLVSRQIWRTCAGAVAVAAAVADIVIGNQPTHEGKKDN